MANPNVIDCTKFSKYPHPSNNYKLTTANYLFVREDESAYGSDQTLRDTI